MSKLMQYSSLQRIFKGRSNIVSTIINLYEKIRHDQRINDEPLFWLQYAIAMSSDRNKLLTAQEFIGTAYERAASRVDFQTYQIDTQSLRILLLIEENHYKGLAVKNIEEIIERLNQVNSMINEESHRGYAIKVLNGISMFVRSRINDITLNEKTALVYWIIQLINSIENLSSQYKAQHNTRSIVRSLESARQDLLK